MRLWLLQALGKVYPACKQDLHPIAEAQARPAAALNGVQQAANEVHDRVDLLVSLPLSFARGLDA